MTNPSQAKGQLVDGNLNESLWYRPGAITIDNADNLYVMDSWDSFIPVTSSTSNIYFNYAIRRVSVVNNYVTTMAGKYCKFLKASNNLANPSSVCYSDGNSTSAGISKVKALTVSSYLAVGAKGDKFYFTDYGNNVVRKLFCDSKGVHDNMRYGQCPCKVREVTPPVSLPSVKPTLAPSAKPFAFPSQLTLQPSSSRRPSKFPTGAINSKFPT